MQVAWLAAAAAFVLERPGRPGSEKSCGPGFVRLLTDRSTWVPCIDPRACRQPLSCRLSCSQQLLAVGSSSQNLP